jgi:hypothetical protein
MKQLEKNENNDLAFVSVIHQPPVALTSLSKENGFSILQEVSIVDESVTAYSYTELTPISYR